MDSVATPPVGNPLGQHHSLTIASAHLGPSKASLQTFMGLTIARLVFEASVGFLIIVYTALRNVLQQLGY